MKLRNKKTGEKKDVLIKTIEYSNSPLGYPKHKVYNSIAELSKEWEDYEDRPYVIDMWEDNCICDAKFGVELEGIERAKECGLYFETKEEAEKAVEKLKAWERLKDGGFVFCGKGDCLDTIKFDYGPAGYNRQDFSLLFGGEE